MESPFVIRAVNDNFEAYVAQPQIGTDFSIEMGKGYIVNVLSTQTFEVMGQPWGDPVPAAPPTETPDEPWAFVVAGRVDGGAPVGGRLRVTNRRTGESRVVPISPVEHAASLFKNERATRSTGEFIAAFVDMRQHSVVAAGDEIVTQTWLPYVEERKLALFIT